MKAKQLPRIQGPKKQQVIHLIYKEEDVDLTAHHPQALLHKAIAREGTDLKIYPKKKKQKG